LEAKAPAELNRRYDRGTPEFDAYLASLRADGLHEDADRMELKGDCYLRPSLAQGHMARHGIGLEPVAGITGAVLARAIELQRAQQREPGRG
jgi:hypothetical protein